MHGELWEADLETGRTRPMLPGFTVASYDVSSDGKRLVFSAADGSGRPRVWLAALDEDAVRQAATFTRPWMRLNTLSPTAAGGIISGRA